MREESNLLYGKSLILERPEELKELSAPLSRAVPRRTRELFTSYPASFRALAAESSFAPLARWLRKLAKVDHCELAIHRPGPPADEMHPEVEVFLQAGGDSNAVLLSGGLARIPKRCPDRLAEILGSVGVVRQQYGAAGGLIAPARQRPLPSLLQELKEHATADPERIVPGFQQEAFLRTVHGELTKSGVESGSFEQFAERFGRARGTLAAEAATTPMPPRASGYHTYYEDSSGGFRAANRQGETWLFPMAGGDSMAGPPLDAWFKAFFDGGPAFD